MPNQSSRQNNMAIASLITGILSIPMLCLCYLGVPLAIVAVILGVLGRKKANEEMGGEGAGVALAGMITGGVTLGLVVVGIAFYAISALGRSV